MSQEARTLLIVGIVTVALLIGGVIFLSAKQPKTDSNNPGETVYQIDYSKGEKIGSDSAKVKLVEFGDFRCPACAAYESAVGQIRTKPGIQLIFRHFAFLGPASTTAANAAECAGEQGKFWEYHDWLYKNQPAETDTSLYTSDKLTAAAGTLGLNSTQFKACLETNKYAKSVTDDLKEGQALGVNSTPTFFLNGQKLSSLGGPQSLATQVDNALK